MPRLEAALEPASGRALVAAGVVPAGVVAVVDFTAPVADVAVVGVVGVVGVVDLALAPVLAGAAAPVVRVSTAAVVPEVDPESPTSLTSAAARTPSEIAMTSVSAISGRLQFGAAASLVRAAAPHFRHHSCSGRSGPPHSGQTSRGCGWKGGDSSPATPAGPAEGCATLTFPERAAAGSR